MGDARPSYENAAAVAFELVRQYYTVQTQAPEHLWRFYGECAQYVYVAEDGATTVAADRPALGYLIADTATAKVEVQSVNVAQCSEDRLLVVAMTDRFAQSFVIESVGSRMLLAASIVRHFPGPRAEAVAEVVMASASTSTDNGRNGDQLFVGGLTGDTRAHHLHKTFGKYGDVLSARIMSGRNCTGNPARYNYAFVRFRLPAAVDAALADCPITLCNGNEVNVHPSKGRPRRAGGQPSNRNARHTPLTGT